ncbi:MAG: sugar phosphate isomerase/epimerase family protein [Acidimicrobiia bacterium]
MAIELALTADARWGCSLDDLIPAAARAGFAGISMRAGIDVDHVNELLRASRVRCHEVLALTITNEPGVSVAQAEQLAATASAVGAPWVLTIFRAPPAGEVAAIIKRCAEIVTAAGAAMAVEFSPFGPVNSIARGLEVVELASTASSRAGLMIDTWHFTVGPSTWHDLETVPIDKVAYLQFDDGREPIGDDLMHETLDRRALPGEGTFDVERFATTLLERGFDGVVSAEVLMAELLDLPSDVIATRIHDAMARYWR